MKINDKIIEYFKKNFPSFKKENNFKVFDYLDSVGIYDFIYFLEKSFKIKISDNEINIKNFESIENLKKFVEKKIKKK